MVKRLWVKLKNDWSSLLIEFVLLVIVGGLLVWGITYYITDSLKAQTDIDVTCKIEKIGED
ncbi:hypothetical protein HYU06_04755 [Candidatus Woesearchaeota archaeon]|nr:hypothetical protein [Candidatus Woesearchaeota archaeon]